MLIEQIKRHLLGVPVIFALYPDRACLWRRGEWLEGLPLSRVRLFLQMMNVDPDGGTNYGCFRQLNVTLGPKDERMLYVMGIAKSSPEAAGRKLTSLRRRTSNI